jgi:hypothetical protein
VYCGWFHFSIRLNFSTQKLQFWWFLWFLQLCLHLSLASCSIGELSFVWKGLDFSSPFLLLVVMKYSVLSFWRIGCLLLKSCVIDFWRIVWLVVKNWMLTVNLCLWFGGGQFCVPTTDFNVQGS